MVNLNDAVPLPPDNDLSDPECQDRKRLADLELQDENDEPEFLRQVQVDSDGSIAVQRLGLDALDPSFRSVELLHSAGIDVTSAENHALDHQNKLQSPFTWPAGKKMVVLSSPFLAAALAAYSAGSYALASGPLRDKWQVTSTEFNVGITIFVTGFGFAPMILAPVSEAYGRYWVFAGSGIVFFVGTLGCAITDSYGGMIISRLVTGSGASVFATLTGGVVSDIYRKEDRNTPMSLYSLAILFGTGLGPLLSGVIVDRLGWRWIFYVQLMAIGATTLAILALFQETRSNVVLSRKCDALNKMAETHGPPPGSPPVARVQFQPQTTERKLDISVIYRSFAFPMRLLMSEPVVFCFSLWASFAWAILYMQFSSIGIVFQDVYNFSNTQVGAVYTAVIMAAIIGTVLAIVQDPITRRIWPQRMATPEGRLMAPCIQSILLPAGLFWFGWTSKPTISWVSPALAIGSCTIGIFGIYLAVFNYLADTYGRFASSAQAAQSMCRNLFAGIFPLFTHIMLRNLTYKGAGSMLGGIGLLLTVIPWLLSFYGQRVRARSPFAKAVMEM